MATVENQVGETEPDGGATDSLSFLDLFYAVPVGDLAVRVSSARLDRVTGADWSTIAVELAVLLFSWVGLHLNRADMARRTATHWRIGNLRFTSLRFVQFGLEVAITALYFVLGLTIDLPVRGAGQRPSLPSERWVLATLLTVWLAYVAWDQLDVRIAGKNQDVAWARTAAIGGNVSLVVAGLLAVLLLAESAWPAKGDHAVVVWNLGLLVVLYAYRVAQQRATARWGPTDVAPSGKSTDVRRGPVIKRSRRHDHGRHYQRRPA